MKFVSVGEETTVNLNLVVFFEDSGEDYTRVHFSGGTSLLSKIPYDTFKIIADAAEESLRPDPVDFSPMGDALMGIHSRLSSMQKQQQYFIG